MACCPALTLYPACLFLFMLLRLLADTRALAAVRYVNATSADPAPPYTNWANAARVIQDAVDAAVEPLVAASTTAR